MKESADVERPEQHSAFRDAVLQVNQRDLKRVAETYLQPEQASIGIVTHQGEAENYQPLCDTFGIDIQQL